MYPERLYVYISFLLNQRLARTGLVKINQSSETTCIILNNTFGKHLIECVCVGGGGGYGWLKTF